MPAQKESIPDRPTGHAKKGDFGPKKQSSDAPITKQESHIPDRCSYFTGLRPDSFVSARKATQCSVNRSV